MSASLPNLVKYCRDGEKRKHLTSIEIADIKAVHIAGLSNLHMNYMGKEQTMSDRKRCCCNCRRCVRTWDGGNCTTHCEIDGHYIGYIECFEGLCHRWAKDPWQEERSE